MAHFILFPPRRLSSVGGVETIWEIVSRFCEAIIVGISNSLSRLSSVGRATVL